MMQCVAEIMRRRMVRLMLAFVIVWSSSSLDGGVVLVVGLGDQVSDLPLYESTPTHCDEMLDLHKWDGTCCSLNVTEGNGCILNVQDGNCHVRGQIWTLNYTSTSTSPCPPSEYSNALLGITPPKLEPPLELDVDSSDGSLVGVGGVIGHFYLTTVVIGISWIVTLTGVFL